MTTTGDVAAARLYNVVLQKDLPARMRDGTTLYADVYRPYTTEQLPVILMRLPYDKITAEAGAYAHPAWYASQGYVVVVQDCRGRWRSDGEFYALANEAKDGYDTVEWAAGLPWSNGKVGMYGFSYPGATQLLASVERPPHLTCICPAMTGSDYYHGWAYRGGAFSLAFNLSWALGLAAATATKRGLVETDRMLRNALLNVNLWYSYMPLKDLPPLKTDDIAPYYFHWIEHSTYDDYWKSISIERRHDQIEVPALHVAGWYDIFLDGNIKNFLGIREKGATPQARSGQKLLIGPWYHGPWSRMLNSFDFGPEAANRVNEYQVRWFDHWLKGIDNGIMSEPPVRIFVMGDNVWRSENEWPLARTQFTPFYLHSRGRANSMDGDGYLNASAPDGSEPPDVYLYNPRGPVFSYGGRSCCNHLITPMGPADQREAETGGSVLCYTSDPLERDMEVTGPVSGRLWAVTDALDTDWTMKLVDVYPDGRAINVCDGIIRARFREGFEEERLLEPGRVYQYDIDLGATSYVFKAGHRIRVDVSSSNFPHFDRNTNTGHKLGEDTLIDAIVATQTVLHDADHPSHIILPVIPR